MGNIVLIGMPGCGKSTAGVLLAKTLKLPFIDTDLLIQTAENRFLQEIIDTEGMEAFLDIEERAITSLALARDHVIATGGSVIYRESTMNFLRASGMTVYLMVSCTTLEERLRNIATRGIARRAGQTLCELLAERHPGYLRFADHCLDVDRCSTEEVVTLLAALRDK